MVEEKRSVRRICVSIPSMFAGSVPLYSQRRAGPKCENRRPVPLCPDENLPTIAERLDRLFGTVLRDHRVKVEEFIDAPSRSDAAIINSFGRDIQKGHAESLCRM